MPSPWFSIGYCPGAYTGGGGGGFTVANEPPWKFQVSFQNQRHARSLRASARFRNRSRPSTVYFCLRMREKMASAELGVVRLGVSGFDKEFADWCREELNCFLLGQVTARGWYVQGSCLSVGQAHSLLCVNFPRCFSARLQIEKAGRWASTAALQSVHCRINGLLTCRDFSDFPLWKNVDMDTSQKSVFARLGWIPHLCCAGGCDRQPSQMAEKGLPVVQSFFAATVTALRREFAAHIEIRGTGWLLLQFACRGCSRESFFVFLFSAHTTKIRVERPVQEK